MLFGQDVWFQFAGAAAPSEAAWPSWVLCVGSGPELRKGQVQDLGCWTGCEVRLQHSPVSSTLHVGAWATRTSALHGRCQFMENLRDICRFWALPTCCHLEPGLSSSVRCTHQSPVNSSGLCGPPQSSSPQLITYCNMLQCLIHRDSNVAPI